MRVRVKAGAVLANIPSPAASSGPGYVTASGRMSDDAGVYVVCPRSLLLYPVELTGRPPQLDNCKFTLAASATADTTGKVYLGRPWRAYARVIIQESKIESHIRPEGWSVATRLGAVGLRRPRLISSPGVSGRRLPRSASPTYSSVSLHSNFHLRRFHQ